MDKGQEKTHSLLNPGAQINSSLSSAVTMLAPFPGRTQDMTSFPRVHSNLLPTSLATQRGKGTFCPRASKCHFFTQSSWPSLELPMNCSGSSPKGNRSVWARRKADCSWGSLHKVPHNKTTDSFSPCSGGCQIRVSAWLVLVKSLFLACRQLTSCWVFPWLIEIARSLMSLPIRALIGRVQL